MSLMKELANTFCKCVAAGSGQMVGMAIGMAGSRAVAKAVVAVINKVKDSKIGLEDNKPYRRMVDATIKN